MSWSIDFSLGISSTDLRRTGVPASGVDRALRDEADRRAKLIKGLLKDHGLKCARVHLLKGEPADEIPKLVKKLSVDLLIMGTVCRVGIPGFNIGNTAERVLDEVDCSVLTVKPEGFVSPIAVQVS